MIDFTTIIPVALFFFFFPFISIYLIGSSGLVRFFADVPDKRKVNSITIPRIGGFCVLLGFFLTILILFVVGSSAFSFWLSTDVGKSIILSAVVIFIIGFIDDTTFLEISAGKKFIVQLILASAIVFGFDLYIKEFDFLGNVYKLGIFGQILTIFWIVGVMNAFNIIDGIDGLMGSLSLVSIAFITLIFVFLDGGIYQEYMIITIPVMAMILAFLRYNYSPATVFAGDSGSLFFGAIVAILSVKLGTLDTSKIETLSVFYVVALPVTEVLISIIRRYAYGRDAHKSLRERIKMTMQPDNRHMHHRLITKGYSHEKVLFFLTTLSILFALCALLLLLTNSSFIKIVIILYSLFVILRIIDYLGYSKGFLKVHEKKSLIEKYIFIYSTNEFFEESIIAATKEDYLIEKFETIFDEYKKKNIISFVIYNERNSFLERDIDKIYEIRRSFNTAIFFISSAKNLQAHSYILEKEKNVYFMEKPCDITMLIHNIDKISYSGEVSEGIFVIGKEEENASKS